MADRAREEGVGVVDRAGEERMGVVEGARGEGGELSYRAGADPASGACEATGNVEAGER